MGHSWQGLPSVECQRVGHGSGYSAELAHWRINHQLPRATTEGAWLAYAMIVGASIAAREGGGAQAMHEACAHGVGTAIGNCMNKCGSA